ncbi:TonB-dependent receptor [Marinilongibacter aquaticus]|uniref:SusC/RagA family TonB-linked outer membrane protein n=1 Tax=Marinilongibacter aquaticus TaxID=2975157 RepID=UPI0021BD1BFD|nr:TonB-dependent receptor [Marinilongibacter aquaticus]UBM58386.1 TonB-dependent receptor [Marinilongibacter aquaticus]
MKIKLLFLAFISLLFVSELSAQTGRALSGKVTDESGTALTGVSVSVVGTTVGAITNADGEYTITLPENTDEVVFSFIGMKPQTIAVNNRSKIDVTLESDATLLESVVVVAYGTQKKSDITGAVVNIKSKELTDVTTSSASNMLQGKVAGVQISQGSGQPGSTPVIRIRGKSSLNSSVDPLWVVDGMIMHGTPNLNPNEIESISVLKDAAATSLYGSRAANGVVVVTTKGGKVGSSSFSVSSKYGVSTLNQGNFKLHNSQQLYDYYKNLGNPESVPDWFTDDVLKKDFDWVKNGTRTGQIQDHNVTYTSGTDKSRTFISGGYYQEEGAVKGYNYERYSFRMNLDYDVNSKLTISPKLAMNSNNRSDRQHSLYEMYLNMPWDSPYDANGELINPRTTDVWYGRDQSNYLYDLQWNYGRSSEFNMFGNFDFQYDITKTLKFVSTNGLTLYNSDGLGYTDPQSISGEANQGSVSNSNAKRVTRFTNQMLRYTNSFGNHRINALAAYEYNDYNYMGNSAKGIGIISGNQILDGTSSPNDVSGTRNEYALQSLLMNVDYNYDDRYHAQFSIRRDGASNFGENSKYGTFYAMSGGWNIHKESFFNVRAINALKLRASYGGVGNRPGSLYPQYDLYGIDNSYNSSPAATPTQLGNSDLSWEKSYETNIGLDSRLFNRLSLTMEYYVKNTSGLLYYVKLPSVTGYDGYWENIGGVVNKGFEAIVSYDVIQNKPFTWTLDFNIGLNRNKITELYDDQEIDRGTKIFKEGYNLDTWYMRKWAGVDPATGNPTWEIRDKETDEVTISQDYNTANKQILGNSTPKFFGGFSSSMSYKNFSLRANFTYVKGNMIYNQSRELYDADGAYPTYNQQVLADGWSRWEKPGDIATHPKAYYGGNNNSNKVSSRYLEDGSYLRLRNVTLAYNLPSSVAEKLRMSNLGIYISGDNLLTFTKFSGMDPEVGDSGTYNTLYPLTRRMVLGLNLTF